MKQKVSELYDDELNAENSEFIIKAMKGQAELKQYWSDISLIGDTLRSSPKLDVDYHDQVMSALSTQPTVLVRTTRHLKLWQLTSVVAIAAGIASVVLLAWILRPESGSLLYPDSTPASTMAAILPNISKTILPDNRNIVPVIASSPENLHNYLLIHHAETGGFLWHRSSLPYSTKNESHK